MSDEKTIEQELCDALNTKPKAKEHRQDYLLRLVQAARKMPEDDWNALRESPTQEWVNKNLELLNAGREKGNKDAEIDLVDFPDQEQEDKVTGTQTAEDDNKPARKRAAANGKDKDKEKPAKKAATEKAEKKTAKEPTERRAAPKEKAEKKPARADNPVAGSRLLIKQLVIDDPLISTDDLLKKLEKKGLTPTKLATSSIRSSMLQSVKLVLALPLDRIKELKKQLSL